MKTMIKSITPADIVIGERQRKIFPDEDMTKLRNSIREFGLFHAPGINPTNNTLVFGERRTRVLKSLIEDGYVISYNGKEYVDKIPFVSVAETSELRIREMELAENLDRLDLTWQEKSAAVADLEALRNTQREEVAAITDSPTRPVTLAELAEETGKSTASVSRDLQLSKHLNDPDVVKAKSAKDAMKIVERKAKQAHKEERAKIFKDVQSQHTLINDDCRAAIKTLLANQFSVVVTDPPYGIDMHKDQSWDGTWHNYNDSESYVLNLISSLLPEWDRVTQDQAHLYLFCDHTKFDLLRALFDCYRMGDSGECFEFFDFYKCALADIKGLTMDDYHNDVWEALKEKTVPVYDVMPFPFIWDKGNVASYPRPEHWPRKSFECILYAIKGQRTQHKLDLAVINIPQKQHHDHPAGKPFELYQHLIERSAFAGEHVLDCFAGQGTIFRAAEASNTVATGIELSAEYHTLAVNTLIDLEK